MSDTQQAIGSTPLEDEFLVACEVHSPERLAAVLDAGLDPRAPIRGLTPVTSLLEMYFRSSRLPDCLRVLLDRGGELEDPLLAPVLLDDAHGLARALRDNPALLEHRTTMHCAFTPLQGASLLHVAAEYGHVAAARALIESGADVDAISALDEHGLGGHTPLFHTVNSLHNRAAPVLRLLLATGARTDIRLKGLTWGKGFEWETTLFDVTPICYAQFGLLPQFHRDEGDIYDIVRLLLDAAGRPVPPLDNVPNRYLRADDVNRR